MRNGECVYSLRPPPSVEETSTGRIPYAFHFSYKVDKTKKEYLVANGPISVLDVLPAGGTLRSPYYKFVRESLGLPVDHLYEVVDPRHSGEPLLLDLSGSVDVMGAHREDERSGPGHHDQCVWLLRGVEHASAGSDTQPIRKATVTLGWVDQEFPGYWGTNNRMVLLLKRDSECALADQTRLIVPFTEFLDLCGWTVAAAAKAQHYRAEFEAGRLPSFEEAEALIKFPPSKAPGVYGVYTADTSGGHLADLPKKDAMFHYFKFSLLGRPPQTLSSAKTSKSGKKGGGKTTHSGVDEEIPTKRPHNTRHTGADMSRVRPRYDPDTLVPDPRLLKVKPIWQDPEDARPWAEMRGEIITLLELRARSYDRDPGKPSPEVIKEREDIDRALHARAQCYAKRAGDTRSKSANQARAQDSPVSAPRQKPRGERKRAGVSTDPLSEEPISKRSRSAQLPVPVTGPSDPMSGGYSDSQVGRAPAGQSTLGKQSCSSGVTSAITTEMPAVPGVNFWAGNFRAVADAMDAAATALALAADNPNALRLAADQLRLAAALLRVVAPSNL